MGTRRYLIALAMTTVLGAPVVAFANEHMGGGSHPTGTQQAHTLGLHFGRDTNRWGPFLSQRQPATIGSDPVINRQYVACPCDVVRDPFKRRIFGGVPENLENELKLGVIDQSIVDHRISGVIYNTDDLAMEQDLMQAVWGPHFDPAAP
jgi:hypothetical protein